jgi:hypothetical protein
VNVRIIDWNSKAEPRMFYVEINGFAVGDSLTLAEAQIVKGWLDTADELTEVLQKGSGR